MDPRTLQFVAEACDGELRNASPEREVSRVCTDSRQVQPGDLFVALRGERFDAHEFLADVVAKGAAACVAEAGKLPPGFSGPVIAVEDSRLALGRLASRYRADFDLHIIAVGGSNGKTTTKELIAAVLRQQMPTVWSEASFNNDIGVPLTLLKIGKQHRAAVLEVGTNHPGELAPLLQMIRPRYSVITSVGREHLEYFGDMMGVVKEEGTLAELLPANGKLFVNGETEWIRPILKRARVPVVKVGHASALSQVLGKGWTRGATFCARSVKFTEEGVTFSVLAPDRQFSGDYGIRLLGRHQVSNALLAIAMGVELGLNRASIERGLAEAQPAKMRMQVSVVNGVRILDDAYNANADSMLAALQTLKDLPCRGRRVAVLGDMAELGTHSEESHLEVGRRAAELQIDQLFAVGKMASVVANGARGAGLRNIEEIREVDQAAGVLKSFLKPGDVVLLKASRSTRLERVGDALRQPQ